MFGGIGWGTPVDFLPHVGRYLGQIGGLGCLNCSLPGRPKIPQVTLPGRPKCPCSKNTPRRVSMTIFKQCNFFKASWWILYVEMKDIFHQIFMNIIMVRDYHGYDIIKLLTCWNVIWKIPIMSARMWWKWNILFNGFTFQSSEKGLIAISYINPWKSKLQNIPKLMLDVCSIVFHSKAMSMSYEIMPYL